ncbi:cell division protein FtsA [Thermoanaerobacterium sp. RBIITD]|uniref:cell division protein FtsA n=1 Tax=Thermoanaerobacterium sp. RBIITD TaxID=1550240 RepID=UPI000BB7E337|nr:cell division protein FtsA [Thermoanaerobacterium sp. RBIITD]SNX52783.1 cell division protein FtsA [Thermoanaerobacterium sp. RBIITD]
MSDIITGIDIGTSKVCTIIGQCDKNGELRIIGIGFYPCNGMKKGVVVDIETTAFSIKKSIEQAERMANQKVTSVYIKIPGGLTDIYRNKGIVAVTRDDKEITKQDVERVLQAAKIMAIPSDKQIIELIPVEYIVDGYGEIRDPVGMAGIRLEVDAAIVTGSLTAVQNMEKCIKKAGIDVSGIIVEPLATAEAVMTRDERELGAALIDIGAGITDISVFNSGNLVYSALIPVGGNHITNDLSIGLKISYEEAENIKKKYGSVIKLNDENDEVIKISNIANRSSQDIRLNDIIDIIEARVSEILTISYEQLKKSETFDLISTNIVITGGGIAFIKGSIDLAKNIFDKNVRLGVPDVIGVSTPVYSAGVGIVRYVYANRKYLYGKQNEQSKEKNKKKNGIFLRIKELFNDFWV